MTAAGGSVTGAEGRVETSTAAADDDGRGTDREVVFVVGCPRSGTTWVQLLLDEHPEVVTAPETQIFAYYLDHFQRQWRHEQEGATAKEQGAAGLSRLLSEQEFDDLCRTTALGVLDRIADRDSEAQAVVEKSPRHALHVQWIHRLFPDARFLHVIRDPRDTVSSLIAAGRSWGSGWAPRGPVEAARRWCDNVGSARSGRGFGAAYREIRYEELNEDAAVAIREVYRWLGLRSDREVAEEAAEACRLARLRDKADGEQMPIPGQNSPDGFFRKGKTGGWREDLSPGQVRVVEHLCGELMQELGYEKSQTARVRPALRVALHDGLQRIREAVDWQFERLVRRV